MQPLSPTFLRQSWRAWLGSDSNPPGPRWLSFTLSFVWTFVFSALCAVLFTVLGFAKYASGEGAWRNLGGWWQWYQVNLVVSLCIGFTIRGLFWLGHRALGLQRLRQLRGMTRLAYFCGLPMVGVAIGWPLGGLLTGYDAITWKLLDNPNALVASLLVSLVVITLFYTIFNAAAHRLNAEKRAAEAQLRLLQAQIEPHFLFNTLANVISLIDHDALRAKQMLESFTDYLRSSLSSLRHQDATLGTELDLAQTYLDLLKMRMEDRLRFSIDATADVRGAQLPPLLLQPLVENAIHHGLEPKVDGGHVQVRAHADGATLVLEVADDGLGLDAPPRRSSAARNTGMALDNVRERLRTQYGSSATLTLERLHPGTLATVRLPLQLRATP